MATTIKTKTGKSVTLLNPSEKGKKFAKELKCGFKMTNDMSLKLNSNKKGIKLTDEERAFRSGYLTAQSDNAKCFNAKHGKKTTKRK